MAAKNFESMLDTIGNMSVLELADFVKAIEEKFGVSAAVQMAAPAAAATESPKEEKTQFKVELESAGDKKIEVIKALRKVVPNLGLTEAKAFTEKLGVIADSVSKDDAQKMKTELEAAGAKVKLS